MCKQSGDTVTCDPSVLTACKASSSPTAASYKALSDHAVGNDAQVFGSCTYDPGGGAVTVPFCCGLDDGVGDDIDAFHFEMLDDASLDEVLLLSDSGDELAQFPTSNDLVVTVDGNAGDDTIGGSGAETGYSEDLRGGEGEDLIEGGPGDDDIWGGDDADTLNGGDGADEIRGGAGADEINGSDGNDEIFGDGGADDIDGGIGDDDIFGGDGDDIILGHIGGDDIDGGDGDDDIDGGAGIDTIFGGDGDDTIDGGLGDDELHGEDGVDYVDGNKGDDVLCDTPGRSTCAAGDVLIGGENMDQVWMESTALCSLTVYYTGTEVNAGTTPGDMAGNDADVGWTFIPTRVFDSSTALRPAACPAP